MSDNKYVETKIHYLNVEDRHVGGGGTVYRDNVEIPRGWEVIQVISVPTIVRMTKQVREGHYTSMVECEPQVLNMPALLLGRRHNEALQAMQGNVERAEANAARYQRDLATTADNLAKRTEEAKALQIKVQTQETQIETLKKNYNERVEAVKRAEKMAADASNKLDTLREYVGEKTYKEALAKEDLL